MSTNLQISEPQAVYLEKFLNFQGSIASFAAAMDIPLVDMIDILSAPPTKQRLKAAAKLTKLKRKIIITEIEITALKILEQIAKNTHTPILERRRAASSILRAIHKPKPRRYRYPPTQRPPSPPQPPNNPPPPSDDLDDSDDPTINYFDELLTQLQETANHTSTDPLTDSPTDRATDLLYPEGLCPNPTPTSPPGATTRCAAAQLCDCNPDAPNSKQNAQSQTNGQTHSLAAPHSASDKSPLAERSTAAIPIRIARGHATNEETPNSPPASSSIPPSPPSYLNASVPFLTSPSLSTASNLHTHLSPRLKRKLKTPQALLDHFNAKLQPILNCKSAIPQDPIGATQAIKITTRGDKILKLNLKLARFPNQKEKHLYIDEFKLDSS